MNFKRYLKGEQLQICFCFCYIVTYLTAKETIRILWTPNYLIQAVSQSILILLLHDTNLLYPSDTAKSKGVYVLQRTGHMWCFSKITRANVKTTYFTNLVLSTCSLLSWCYENHNRSDTNSRGPWQKFKRFLARLTQIQRVGGIGKLQAKWTVR